MQAQSSKNFAKQPFCLVFVIFGVCLLLFVFFFVTLVLNLQLSQSRGIASPVGRFPASVWRPGCYEVQRLLLFVTDK